MCTFCVYCLQMKTGHCCMGSVENCFLILENYTSLGRPELSSLLLFYFIIMFCVAECRTQTLVQA